ncbi:Uncharacterized protein OS=Singulisphaera acidiphila (strain ATCC BAA-1392 / DSM 18658 / VKM B-2454 / MOB10) GN=Sinac_5936 PE=4 SV=1: Peptidase_MA_2 [Gemmataceae bacterium]|nr:Uncharacterized protein OS=Singulisphaera acidiphila (strain ATCC BAA-1392 / DSM 18658 / VKM B-2454 / MOB10) GN=Sinac_5936 PE=4 SV=1: Peptidase_MA_2 [Gemmataceae bacterium]VTT99309.1 Uncharacterized protein OS=Singulisphaera acidiphila (strain ATCC BAA-1392 / DSM 18658 / VKM B-2454 / MOB10) GN=Sinac_5936 PE=4 SV=1: Peptidase_MA_2 [Gemmataceae bacterium]
MLSRRTVAAICAVTFLAAAEPQPVERPASVQKAMATARQCLNVGMSAEAVTALESELPAANGDKVYLGLLREAYLAELYRLEKADAPDATRLGQMRRNIALLGGKAAPAAAVEAAPPAATTPTPDAADAAAAFKRGDYAGAEKLFAKLASPTADQKTAWAYCRIKLAADRLNTPGCTPAAAAAALADASEAVLLVPHHPELQKIGEAVIAAATARQKNAAPAAAVTTGGDAIETESFVVRCAGNRELAESLAKVAEAQRKAIFERWSGPPAAAWAPKCEIVVHATAEVYAKATTRPTESTGTAAVQLDSGRATSRRIDLRADDAAIASNALPRELTHVVLADLFPDRPPPKWAAEGMAILAGTPEESGRYLRTLPRCARDGDWHALAQLLEMKDFPAEKVTGFYCQSVSLTDHLIRAAGNERNFTIFLRDTQRYGTASALKRQYGFDSPQALEASWKRAALETARGQAP